MASEGDSEPGLCDTSEADQWSDRIAAYDDEHEQIPGQLDLDGNEEP